MGTFLFSAPIMIIISIVLIVYNVGWIGLIAPIFFFLVLIFQNYSNDIIMKIRKKQLIFTD